MVLSKERGEEISETGNWNVAQSYSNLKVMKLLYLADEYEKIALFGSSDIVEDILNSVQGINKDELRLTGYRRLLIELIMLINNTIFAVKEAGKSKLEEYKKELNKFSNEIDLIYQFQYNAIKKSRRLIIDEKKFKFCLDRVIEIKSLINSPLNDADLIFTARTQLSAKEMKEKLFKSFTERG
ncbi:MAG: hypothetical protein WC711_04070 [Candidatus Staskawiczbacteria bacterium]|jgi:hypothetical protein